MGGHVPNTRTEIRTRKAGITLAGGVPDIQAHPPR